MISKVSCHVLCAQPRSQYRQECMVQASNKQNSDQDQAKAGSKGKRDDGSCLVLWNRHLGKETISLVCENYSTEFISTCGLYIIMNAHIINPFGLLQNFFYFVDELLLNF